MGHLLSSINKEAAERIENPGMDAPDVGTMVVYRSRTGMMRMGRTEFPGLVLGHDDEGHLDLLVMMEPEDMMLEQHVRPWVEGNGENQGHCWRPVDGEIGDVDHRLEQLEEKNRALELELADIKKMILGEYKPAKLSVYDLLAEFEGKLKKALKKG